MIKPNISKVSNETSMTTDTDQAFVQEVINDFWICCVSRETSLMARREVLTGKAKFGITGDGKEVPQVAMARAFKKGDWRSGYYRDQTFMMALGLCSVEEFFAQLYSHPEADPYSGGRQMNSHFATPMINAQGEWNDLTAIYNTSSDISCTAGQMARSLGLSLASKKFREGSAPKDSEKFSKNGNEVCFTTIGDASTSEGIFWETLNAASVMQVPLAVSVWDDGYGISVPKKYQTTKESISDALAGFEVNHQGQGIHIYTVKGWDYAALCQAYEKGIQQCREEHRPVLFHIEELTQPQGHSTSGSHERYKSKERLEWERKHDCITVMGQWMVDTGIATKEEVAELKEKAKKHVREAKKNAWQSFQKSVKEKITELQGVYQQLIAEVPDQKVQMESYIEELKGLFNPVISEVLKNARQVYFTLGRTNANSKTTLKAFIDAIEAQGKEDFNTHLYSNSPKAAVKTPIIPAEFTDDSPVKNGFEILNACFDANLEKYDQLYFFGEDAGNIGDVNQGLAGMQKKHGEERVFDTGIREWSIMGQAIGMAMRGLRPIAEIQYLDYLLYGLEPLSDDLASLRWRSDGIQQAPAIIRTRGHRLEGIWHAGSPMGMLISSLRGMYICVPRNMTQAAGFYNTLLQSDDPALVIECLNGYRLKETLPNNISEFTVPLGVPEVLQEGTDVTLVTYGSCIRVAQEALPILSELGISVELIDVQTLLPFDLEHLIVESLKKTNRILFLDEDVPGGATAFMMREVLEIQGGYRYLDSAPETLTAKAHRPAYGSDGDYFSKPQAEDVIERVLEMMREVHPNQF